MNAFFNPTKATDTETIGGRAWWLWLGCWVYALAVSYSIVTERYFFGFILSALLLCEACLNYRRRFVFFSVITLFPFSLGTFMGKQIPAIEWLGPLFFVTVLYMVLRSKNPLLPRGASTYLVIMLLLFGLLCYHFSLRPLSAEIFGASSEFKRGLRNYYPVVIGMAVFLTAFWYFAYWSINGNLWLKLVLIIGIGLGLTRLLTYLSGMEIPFVAGSFHFAGERSQWGKSILRIGGLDTIGLVGSAGLVALYHGRKVTWIGMLSMAVIGMLIILGGGRTVFWGVIFSGTIYLLVFRRRGITKFVCFVLAIALSYYCASLVLGFPSQFDRIFAISGRISQDDPGRSETFSEYWRVFKERPLTGKGIGTINVKGSTTAHEKFVEEQLRGGGHNSYLSILAMFGILGGAYLFVLLFGTIFIAFRLLTQRLFNELLVARKEDGLVVFSLFYLLSASVYYLVALSGYHDMVLFFVSGMTLGLRSKIWPSLQGMLGSTVRHRRGHG